MTKLLRRLALLAITFAAAWGLSHSGLTGSYVPIALTVLRVAFIIALVWAVDGMLSVLFWQRYLSRAHATRVPRLAPLCFSIVLWLSTIVYVLQVELGVSLTGAFAASGVLAIVLGFALRSMILDLFSGIAVSIDRSFEVGDWVTITSRDFDEAVYGQVEDVDWRTTRLRLEDGSQFIIPNSLGGAFSITNHSHPHGPKRLEFSLTLPHETPTDRAVRLLLGATSKAVTGDGFYEAPKPRVLIHDVCEDGVTYLVRFWVDLHTHAPNSARAIVRKACVDAVAANKLPFAGRRVDIQRREPVIASSEAMRTPPETVLRRLPLFTETLSEDEITSLSSTGRMVTFPVGAKIIEQGEEGASLFVLLSGAASVSHTISGGPTHRLATLSTGDVVGEMSLLTGQVRSASVTAETELEALEIHKSDLAPLLEERPGIAEQLSLLLAQRRAVQDGLDIDSSDGIDPVKGVADRLLIGMRQFFGIQAS